MHKDFTPMVLTESPSRKRALGEIRTLFLMNGVPYPPVGGSPLRNRQNIETLRRYGPVRLISFVSSAKKASGIRGAPPYAEFCTKPRRGLIDILVWPFGKLARRWWRGVMQSRKTTAIAREVSREIAVFKPDLIVFEWANWVKYLPNPSQLSAKLIYDAHSVEAVMVDVLQGVRKDGRSRPVHKLKALREAEALLVQTVDQIWVCSEHDRALIGDAYGSNVDTRVVPNGVDVDHYAETVESRTLRNTVLNVGAVPTLLFAATFSHPPNVAAVRFLVDDILPILLTRMAGVNLVLCGNEPPNEVLRYAEDDPTILVTGKVADTRCYFERCDLVVVPLLHGGGTRMKILEAFAVGRPVVSTTKGAEGLDVVDGVHLLIADTAEAMAYQIARCLADRELAARLASAGRAFVTEHHSWQTIRKPIEDAVLALFREPGHRPELPGRITELLGTERSSPMRSSG